MKNHLVPFGGALVLALFVTGCDTDYVSARIQEKSATYATLKVSEKRFIEKGVVATGFTPDMVYMAVGNPSKVEPLQTTDGSKAELWTYNQYYPTVDAAHIEYAAYTSDSPYQRSKTVPQVSGYDGDIEYQGHQPPAGMGRGGDGAGSSIATTGSPEGGTIEPAELQACTLVVLFHEGKVAKLGLKQS